ncbi:MAG: acyl-CoA thioesterase [Gammaproteobacteria bacterium]|nr:acyl-CoA thioesterase [Gammaproteobacteria bacterium]
MHDPGNLLPAESQPVIRILPMPHDTNAAGDIFGGWLMSQVDIAGSITASRRAQGRTVTVAVNEFVFIKPIFVGDLVSLYTEVVHIGNTSIQIEVIAFVERGCVHGACERVAQAKLTYVAIDQDRKPRPIAG